MSNHWTSPPKQTAWCLGTMPHQTTVTCLTPPRSLFGHPFILGHHHHEYSLQQPERRGKIRITPALYRIRTKKRKRKNRSVPRPPTTLDIKKRHDTNGPRVAIAATTPNSTDAPPPGGQFKSDQITSILQTIRTNQERVEHYFIIVKKPGTKVRARHLMHCFQAFSPIGAHRFQGDYYVEFDEANADWAMRRLFGTKINGLELEMERQNLLTKQLPFWELEEAEPKKKPTAKATKEAALKRQLQKIVCPIFESYLLQGHIQQREEARRMRRKLIQKLSLREKAGSVRKDKVETYTKQWIETKLQMNV
mmetsp:Transcript_1268/g.4333  ORF Transcript_1268/g.4333 Transcript_1268/m.4333 type:complete len:307 (-) Transcript_1268:8219-9139(-)